MYTKPVVLANDDLAEGVYAASGSSETSVSVAVQLTSEGSEYYPCNGYQFSFTNDSSEVVTEFSVALNYSGSINEIVIDNSNFTGAIRNGKIVVSFHAPDVWNGIQPNSTLTVSARVFGTLPFSVNK